MAIDYRNASRRQQDVIGAGGCQGRPFIGASRKSFVGASERVSRGYFLRPGQYTRQGLLRMFARG